VAAVVTIYPDASELGDHLACEILDGIERARSARRRFLLGCPGGRSLLSTYQGLARRTRDTRADLAHLVIVMMDEYVVLSGDRFRYCPAHLHYSCRRFAEHEIRGCLNDAIPPRCRIPAQNIWLPDPADPGAFDARLAAAGGVDLFLLASGASDGHVGFNPPGTAIDSGSRVVRLAETTRRDNLGTFSGVRGARGGSDARCIGRARHNRSAFGVGGHGAEWRAQAGGGASTPERSGLHLRLARDHRPCLPQRAHRLGRVCRPNRAPERLGVTGRGPEYGQAWIVQQVASRLSWRGVMWLRPQVWTRL
jgi:glucosamine-6-phosphate deaminase